MTGRMLQDRARSTHLLDGIRAAADPSRLRLLAICSQGEWTVSELVQMLGQSQPRISRHLKILAEAGLLDRFREGSWVFYRRAQSGDGARLARSLCRLLPDDDAGACVLDQRRLEAVREARRRQAERYLRRPRRRLGQRARPGDRRCRGRGRAARAVRDGAARQPARHRHRHRPHPAGAGAARSASGSASTSATTCWRSPAPISTSARRATARSATATCTSCRCPTRSFAAATLHQVLHFADDPFAGAGRGRARAGARRPAGRGRPRRATSMERLREQSGHRRLGFGDEEIGRWFARARPGRRSRRAGSPAPSSPS